MIPHPRMQEWDNTLKAIFDEIDLYLEEKYGHIYSLHPNRPGKGTTANPEMDGLFNVGAGYSTGYGTKLGKGYVVELEISTLEDVSHVVRENLEEEVMVLLRQKLAKVHSGRSLSVDRDGTLIKIHGDLSLGTV